MIRRWSTGGEIDQHVAATDQVQVREGRVHGHVLPGEEAHVANPFIHLVGTVHLRKKPPQTLGRHVNQDVLVINAAAGFFDAAFVQVRGKDLDRQIFARLIQKLDHCNGQRIGLLARSATAGPDANRRLSRAVLQEARQDALLQRRKRTRVAEKTCDADEQVIEERIDFARVLLEVFYIFGQLFEFLHGHAAHDPAVECAGLVKREIHAAARARERKESLHLSVVAFENFFGRRRFHRRSLTGAGGLLSHVRVLH